MLGGKEGGRRARLVIDQEIDPALAPQLDVLGAVIGDMGEAHGLEDRFDDTALRCRELDELEAAEAQRVFEKVCHVASPELAGGRLDRRARAVVPLCAPPRSWGWIVSGPADHGLPSLRASYRIGCYCVKL